MKLFFVFIFPFLFIPQNNSEKITWRENRKLTWEDFKGKPVPSASFVASTNSGISFKYSYSIKNNSVTTDYTVSSFFDPNGSWFKTNQVDRHILNHEQAHFDITEIHARMLRKNLDGKKFSKKVKAEVEVIYKQVEQQRRAMQAKFDVESDHSRNEEKELQWQKLITKKLVEYESWK